MIINWARNGENDTLKIKYDDLTNVWVGLVVKGVAAVTSATRVQLTLGEIIYNVWVFGKEVKPFFLDKKILWFVGLFNIKKKL